MLATELLKRGHEVILHAPAREFAGRVVCAEINPYLYDVVLDMTHDHFSSRAYPNQPIVNLILDRECPYVPPCAAVETEYMRKHYPSARIAPAGIDVDAIPFTETPENYLVFMGLKVDHKQPHVADQGAHKAGKTLRWICPPNDLTEQQKWHILGHALALLAPYTIDAGPRSPLEAAACGTPTICLDGDGTQEHVLDSVTGAVCRGPEEMAVAVGRTFDRHSIRTWIKTNRDVHKTIERHEQLLQAVAAGERW